MLSSAQLRGSLLRLLRPYFGKHPGLKTSLVRADTAVGLAKHTFAQVFPIIVRPQPEKLTVAITALCNYRCKGCRYGRDFMVGKQLELAMVRTLLDDAGDVGITTVRLYGGEPLLHRDLPRMIEHAIIRKVKPYITTNGFLLEKKIDELYKAGLRTITMGYYGFEDDYNSYVGVAGAFSRLERAVSTVRERYGCEIQLQINYLLSRLTCSEWAIRRAWDLACRYDMFFQTDLIHYSLPYFTEGPNRELQFRASDAPEVTRMGELLLELKRHAPARMPESAISVRSIPDWLLKGPEMRIPCDSYRMIWVGADGSVQMCYAAFPLGNLHSTRLKDLLFTDAHSAAARGAFKLDCPRCHCERSTRIDKDLRSRIKYS